MIREIEKMLGDLQIENDKLIQTLAEIKEIAESCQIPDSCKNYCKFFDECVDGGLPLILQKISKLENKESEE